MLTAATLVDVVEQHARKRASQIAYRYLENGEEENATLTFGEVAAQAKQLAGYLLDHGLQGRRVVLAVRHELAFLRSLLACFYAGVIAVPAAIPRRESEASNFQRLARSADACAVLLTRRDAKLHATLLGALLGTSGELLTLYCEDAPTLHRDIESRAQPQQLAFLQYTSGSTGNPKGVQITHANLLANERAIQRAMQLGDATIFVSWLPLFHDMGLVGSALQPLYLGVPCVLMPPQAFLMKPIRWLEAISRYRGTTSGAPNFAYDLCVDKVSDTQRADLDLSSWTVAFNGSEPVRAATLARFTARFCEVGFKDQSFYPCYGMAEGTLIVSGPVPGTAPIVRQCARSALQLGAHITATCDSKPSVAVVGCGQPVLDTTLRVVDPHTGTTLSDGEVGELWIQGPSVSAGYYANSELTQAARGTLPNTDQPFFRTGDLGCLSEGALFVLGRLKDLIIIRGRKYYPQDIESTASASSELLAAGAAAACSLEVDSSESLLIVHELTRLGWRIADPAQLHADIKEAVTREYGITPAAVVLIKPGTLPRTTSGKIRRSLCRELFLGNGFETLSAMTIRAEREPFPESES